jgi:hypothetical protein
MSSAGVSGPAASRLLTERLSWVLLALTVAATIGAAAGTESKLAAVAIVAVPLAILLFLRPDWLPAALAASVFVEGVQLHGVHVSRVAAPIAAVVVVFHLVRGRRLPRFPSKRVLIAAVAYGIWAFSSLLWSAHLGSMFQRNGGTAYALASLILAITYMLACGVLIERAQDVRRLVLAIWFMSAVVGVVALAQYLDGSRPVGLTGDANYFASAQVIALPIGVWLAGRVRGRRERIVILAGMGLTGASIFLAESRGSLVALGGVVVLLAIQSAPRFFPSMTFKRTFLLSAAVCAPVLFAITWYGVGNGVLNPEGDGGGGGGLSHHVATSGGGGSGRTYLWHAAVRGWEDRPLEGLGYGAFTPESNRLLLRTDVNLHNYRLRPRGQPAHNAYLGSLAELGVVGFLLFVAVLAATYSTLRRLTREAEEEDDAFIATLSRALIVSLAGYALCAMFLSIETYRVLWILLGLTLALPRLTRDHRREAA